jgi:hypothetical protein
VPMSCGLTASSSTPAPGGGLGQPHHRDAVPVRELGARSGLRSQTTIPRPAATDQAGEQRLADLPAADDRQAGAAGLSRRSRPARRTAEGGGGPDPSAGPPAPGTRRRPAGVAARCGPATHDVLPAVGCSVVPGGTLAGDGDQPRVGGADAGAPDPLISTLRQRTKARSAAAPRRPDAVSRTRPRPARGSAPRPRGRRHGPPR